MSVIYIQVMVLYIHLVMQLTSLPFTKFLQHSLSSQCLNEYNKIKENARALVKETKYSRYILELV
jgi:hypothetical protein